MEEKIENVLEKTNEIVDVFLKDGENGFSLLDDIVKDINDIFQKILPLLQGEEAYNTILSELLTFTEALERRDIMQMVDSINYEIEPTLEWILSIMRSGDEK